MFVSCCNEHLLLQGFSHLLDAGSLDELGQLKRRFLYASLALQVLPLEAPVTWHGHRVPGGLQVNQQLGLLRRHIVHLHHVRTRHKLTDRGAQSSASPDISSENSNRFHSEMLFEYNYDEDGFIVTHIKGLHNPKIADNVL